MQTPNSDKLGGVPGASEGDAAKDAVAKPAQGISHFLAKVFDQLSLTAWLPAATIVGAGSTLVQMYTSRDPNPFDAVKGLLALGWGGLLLVLFGLLLAAVITQAFSFEALRSLEGYWPNVAPLTWVRALLLTFRRYQKNHLDRRIEQAELAAFLSVKDDIAAVDGPEVAAVLEQDVRRLPASQRVTHRRKARATAEDINWFELIHPRRHAQLERFYAARREYPATNRLLPMRLGNVLRSYEDRLLQQGDALEGYIMRSYELIPSRLMVQHDQYRNRLDLYCTLVPTCLCLAIAAIFLVPEAKDAPPWAYRIGACLVFILASVDCYLASIASARGYGAVLLSVQSYLQRAAAVAAKQPGGEIVAKKRGQLLRLLKRQ